MLIMIPSVYSASTASMTLYTSSLSAAASSVSSVGLSLDPASAGADGSCVLWSAVWSSCAGSCVEHAVKRASAPTPRRLTEKRSGGILNVLNMAKSFVQIYGYPTLYKSTGLLIVIFRLRH